MSTTDYSSHGQPRTTLDFLVIGAEKAGTTALFEHLRQHPNVYLPAAKETPFFGHERPPGRYPGGLAQYLDETFGGAPPDAVRGTATPQYMSPLRPDRLTSERSRPETQVPDRIRAAAPAVRLVAILRNPSRRAYSQYRMELLRGTEAHSFDDAVAELLAPDALRRARKGAEGAKRYVVSGEYGRILSGYYETFAREQLHVLFSEELEYAPGAAVRSVFGHLGVDPGFVPSGLGRRYLQGATRRRVDWLDLVRWHAATARNPALGTVWRRLPPRVKARLLEAYTIAEFRTFQWNRVRAEDPDSTPVAPATWRALDRHYAEDAKLLERLIGRKLPW